MDFIGTGKNSMATKSDTEKRNTITDRNNSMMKGASLIDDIDLRYAKESHCHSFSNQNMLYSGRETESRSSYLNVIFPS
jgi:hypothetical protein